MSRRAQGGARLAAGSTVAPSASSIPTIASDDMCPVCKTIRYLNKDMEFLINPECYHPMCSNCVNRLFNDGPNQCPYAGCHKTLRRKGFRSAFFGDLSVEREVDIRRRVASVFHQVEDDFETLRDYNDYLQMVEDLTFDLVYGDDARRHAAEATLRQWEAEHRAGDAASGSTAATAAVVGDRSARRRVGQSDLESAVGTPIGGDGTATPTVGGATASRVQLKKRGQQLRDVSSAPSPAPTAGGGGGGGGGAGMDGTTMMPGKLSIRGLKDKRKAASSPSAATAAYDPFGGLDFAPARYRVRDDYRNDWLEGARVDPSHVVGGYDVREYFARSLFEAFAGLGVFVADEKDAADPAGRRQQAAAATVGAARAAVHEAPPAVKMEVDDVFG